MPNKPDAAESVAKTLANMSIGAGAAFATSHGIDPYIVNIGREALKGMCEYVIRSFRSRPDPSNVVTRIKDARTAQTVETIRDVLVEAMGLKPEFQEPIEELADAVQATKDGRDEQRFRAALLKFCDTVMQVQGQLDDIKAQTTHIPELLEIAQDNQERVKRIEAAVLAPGRLGEGDRRPTQFLAARVESLTAEVRNLPDAGAKAKWDEIGDALYEHTWQRAFELAQEMERWLNDQADKISSEVKVQGLLTLADVAVIRDSGFPFDDTQDLSDALRLLAKAEAAATAEISDDTASRLLRVRAKLAYINGDHARARAILDQLNDPGAISLKLGMMEEERRWKDASDFAHGRPDLHKKWAAAAVTAHISAGNDQSYNRKLWMMTRQ